MKTALNISLLVVGLVAAVAFSHPRNAKPKAAEIWDLPIGEKSVTPAKWEYPAPIAEPATAPPVDTPDDEDDADESSSPPVAVVPKAKSKCTCGCADGGKCVCGNKCPDILRMPKQMPGGWYSDYGAAKTESERTGKPMLVDLRQPACVYCDALDRELGTIDLSPFVCVRLDRQSAVGVAMQARVAPTLIVAAPDGTVTSRSDGYAPPETIRWHLSSAFRPVAQAMTHPVQTFGRVVTMPVRVMGGACRSGH